MCKCAKWAKKNGKEIDKQAQFTLIICLISRGNRPKLTHHHHYIYIFATLSSSIISFDVSSVWVCLWSKRAEPLTRAKIGLMCRWLHFCSVVAFHSDSRYYHRYITYILYIYTDIIIDCTRMYKIIMIKECRVFSWLHVYNKHVTLLHYYSRWTFIFGMHGNMMEKKDERKYLISMRFVQNVIIDSGQVFDRPQSN